MPIKFHLILLTLSKVIALIGIFILGMSFYESIHQLLPEVMQEKVIGFVVFGMIPAGLSLLLVDFLFKHFISARCSKCDGKAVYRPSQQEKGPFGGKQKTAISYECQKCGYVHRTSVFSGIQKDIT
ncbi:hypothetical protein [Pleionea sediminis]|uniref:hypothetical protein n=1 Tax=Pleionea sediminis TaxID=2569479 RepID=UPI001186BF58|nr:hypothetical protein [Pleionea sediminis]